MDELEALNRDRRRLQAAELIWQSVCPGESLISQVDQFLEFENDLEGAIRTALAHENAPARRI
jgi:hypothetical protein